MSDLDLRDPHGHYDPPEEIIISTPEEIIISTGTRSRHRTDDDWPLVDSWDETREVVER